MRKIGIDMELMWSRIYDIVIKVLICGEHPINKKMKASNINQTNCFELYGFDVLLDSDLKPWLLEVNLSPSLATDSPLDHHIKSNLLTDTFNLIGIQKFDRKKEIMNKMMNRAKNVTQSKRTKSLLNRYQNLFSPNSSAKKNGGKGSRYMAEDTGDSETYYTSNHITKSKLDFKDNFFSDKLSDFLNELVVSSTLYKFKDEIIQTVLEYRRENNFVMIYPSPDSGMYDKFFHNPKSVRAINDVLFKNDFINTNNMSSILKEV